MIWLLNDSAQKPSDAPHSRKSGKVVIVLKKKKIKGEKGSALR